MLAEGCTILGAVFFSPIFLAHYLVEKARGHYGDSFARTLAAFLYPAAAVLCFGIGCMTIFGLSAGVNAVLCMDAEQPFWENLFTHITTFPGSDDSRATEFNTAIHATEFATFWTSIASFVSTLFVATLSVPIAFCAEHRFFSRNNSIEDNETTPVIPGRQVGFLNNNND